VELIPTDGTAHPAFLRRVARSFSHQTAWGALRNLAGSPSSLPEKLPLAVRPSYEPPLVVSLTSPRRPGFPTDAAQLTDRDCSNAIAQFINQM